MYHRTSTAAVVVVALALTHVLAVVLVDLGGPNQHVDREHGGAIAALQLRVSSHQAFAVEGEEILSRFANVVVELDESLSCLLPRPVCGSGSGGGGVIWSG
jgi:hypothetical protein